MVEPIADSKHRWFRQTDANLRATACLFEPLLAYVLATAKDPSAIGDVLDAAIDTRFGLDDADPEAHTAAIFARMEALRMLEKAYANAGRVWGRSEPAARQVRRRGRSR